MEAEVLGKRLKLKRHHIYIRKKAKVKINMKKKGVKILIALIFILMLLYIPKKVFAVNDYTITNYDIDMTVNEDNTFDIVETISVYFNIPRHGIYRKIPLKNSVKRLDGTMNSNKATVTNVKVNDEYSISRENGYKIIKIGNKNTTLTGTHTYIIEYKYNIGKDPLKDVDELYYNLIGTEWDTNIEKVNFTILMPKEFDSSSLGFSSGYYATVDSSNIVFSVNGKEIKGFTKKQLLAGQALTVRLTLPEKYFIKQKIDLKFPIRICMLGGIFTIISYCIWLINGKNKQPIPSVEFYPPEGYNSAELEFLYKGSVEKKGIISLLIYLADKGYLSIEETIEKQINGMVSKGMRIYKKAEYDGNNKIEEIFFNSLFKDKNTVTTFDLQERFNSIIDEIKKEVNSKANREKIFEKKATKLKFIPVLMAIIVFGVITLVPSIIMNESIILPVIIVLLGIVFIMKFTKGLNKKEKAKSKIFIILREALLGMIPVLFSILPALNDDAGYLLSYMIGIGFIIVLSIFNSIISNRTKYGVDILGKIIGLKKFLETAEKSKLEALVEENPSYFFDILPYTYALDVSDKWMERFETISIDQPDWYYTPNKFTMQRFEIFMDRTISGENFSEAKYNDYISDSSGGSGGDFGGSTGGGFSGGGSGGGGGGSW